MPDSDSYTDSYSNSYEIGFNKKCAKLFPTEPRTIPMPIPIPMATVPILAPI